MALTIVRPDTLEIDSGPANSSQSIPARRSDDRSDHAHRQLIGYIGLVLPILLIFMAVVRDGVEQWKELESISAYYYTGAAAAFIGMLVSLALFLFTYRGYGNKHHWADRAASVTAAIAALGVAVFPTVAPNGVQPLSWWSEATGVIHHVFAVVLFAMFAVFALWLFRLSDGQPSRDKEWRNRVYLVCGTAIVVSMIWAGLAARNDKPIFWPESAALFFFSLSWLVKGYAFKTLKNKTRSLLGQPVTA